MRKTYLYRAKIGKQTEGKCFEWLVFCCKLYNLALEERIYAYKNFGKSISLYEQSAQLPKLKTINPKLKAVGSQVLQDVLERLDKAYKGFFRRVKNGECPGFPRFKSRDRYDSFTLKQTGWEIRGRYLYVKNIGRFKLFLSGPIEGNIKTITIRRTSTGKWFVAFSCDSVPVKQFHQTTKDVGIDVGIKSFAVDSEGGQVANPRYFVNAEKQLRRRYRRLSRRKKGSVRRGKAKILVAKAYEKVVNQRKDFLHKTANYYINNFQTVYIEDLKIKNMTRNRYLSKSINDCSWGTFFSILSYKAEEAGRKVIKVIPNGTSQICSGCGEKVPKSLSVRVHKCPRCNLVIDRDLNASINILTVGQTVQALTSDKLELVA